MGGEMNRQHTEDLGGSETIVDTYHYTIIHSFKGRGCTTPRVSPKVNSGFCMIVMHRFRLILVTNVSLWWGVLKVGGLYTRGDRRFTRTLYFSFYLAVNLKLL